MFGNETPIFEFKGPWGVPVQVGGSLVFLVVMFVAVVGSVDAMVYNLIFVAMLVLSIFLHELGHAWGTLVQGLNVRRIMIYGGGGFCERASSATRYQDEFIVAMGPIVNLAIWAIASLAIDIGLVPGGGMVMWAVSTLATMNLFLALFNLIPVQPLDGGKLFQLGLMRILPPLTATRLAGGIGVIFSILWIPAMIICFLTFGLVLFFMPSIPVHWQMFRAGK